MSDETIIAKFQAGDVRAFGELYDRYIERIYAFVRYRIRRKEDAEDVVSKIFFKALKNITDFQTNKGTFKAWLYALSKNCIVDHYRCDKAEEDIETVGGLISDQNVADDIANKLKLEEVDKYLSELKPEQRELVIMRVWDGLSYEEIAVITGKSQASLKMMFSRTIKELRDSLPLAIFILFILNHTKYG